MKYINQGGWVNIESNRDVAALFAARPKKRGLLGRLISPPEDMMISALKARFGDRIVPGFKNSVPGRRFILDAAFPREKIAIEIDGWQFHGKYLADFKRDRERDRELTLCHWRILRFTAEEVYSNMESCLKIIERLLSLQSSST